MGITRYKGPVNKRKSKYRLGKRKAASGMEHRTREVRCGKAGLSIENERRVEGRNSLRRINMPLRGTISTCVESMMRQCASQEKRKIKR